MFGQTHKKLERELHEKKRELAAIIEDSKSAYQARDKAQAELASVRQLVEKEKALEERLVYEKWVHREKGREALWNYLQTKNIAYRTR